MLLVLEADLALLIGFNDFSEPLLLGIRVRFYDILRLAPSFFFTIRVFLEL